MQILPDNDSNYYKILDFVGCHSKVEIEEKVSKLSENELKIYNHCASVLEKVHTDSPRMYKKILDAIHCNTSSREIDYRISERFFQEDVSVLERVQSIFEDVKAFSGEVGIATSGIVKKLEDQPKKMDEDLVAGFADVKESAGVDDYMHRIFLTTNEAGHAGVQRSLKREPMLGNTLVDGHGGNTLIAVSGFCGLNLASVRGEELEDTEPKIDTLIVLDRSTRVEAFWNKMSEIIVSSETRHEVMEKLNKLVKTDEMFKVKLPPHLQYSPLEGLREEILAGNSWLSTTRRFKIIKDIFDNKRFIFKRIDLTDLEAMQSLKAALEKTERKIDTFYVSNISEYLEPDKLQQFKQGVLEVTTDKMFVIDTTPRKTERDILSQRIITLRKEEADPSFCTSSVTLIPKRVDST